MGVKDTGDGTYLEIIGDPFMASLDLDSLEFAGSDTEILETTDLLSTQPDPTLGQFGGKTFVDGKLEDPGRIDADGFFDPEKGPPPRGVQTWRITYPDGTYYEGQGIRDKWKPSGARVNTLMKMSIGIKCSGVWQKYAT